MEQNAAPPVREHHVHQRHFDRLVMLSDGVFAIALTLSAVELRPEAKPGQGLLEIWGTPLFVYFLSFYLIGGVWYQHRRAMAQLRRIDVPLTVLTMLLLSLVALVPVMIRTMITSGSVLESSGSGAEMYVFSPNGFVPYALTMLMIQFCLTAAWAYAAFIARLAPDLLPERSKAWLLHDLSLTVVWAVLIVWGLHMIWPAAVLIVLLAALRIAERRMRRAAKAVGG